MNNQSQSLLKLFSSDSEVSQMSFDSSLSSSPNASTAYMSSSMLSGADSGSSSIVLQSKLNPESAVWTPSSWGDFSPTISKGANTTQTDSDLSTSLSSSDDFAHELLSQAIAQGSVSSIGTP
ncbi:hypothetical protein V2A60_002135 [Cordyceps javanica]